MIKKINRSKCFKLYPKLAHSEVNNIAEDKNFFSPVPFATFAVTCKVQNFEEHVSVIAHAGTVLAKGFGYEHLLFVPNDDVPWIQYTGGSEILLEAMNFLIKNNVDQGFDGGLEVSTKILPVFLKHTMNMVYYHNDIPTINFTDEQQNFMCSVCGNGNVHVDILNPSVYELALDAIAKTKLEIIENDQCKSIYTSTLISKNKRKINVE